MKDNWLTNLIFVIPLFIVCTTIVRFAYYPLVGKAPLQRRALASAVLVVIAVLFGMFVSSSKERNLGGEGYFFSFILLPLVAGWVGNLILDLLLTQKRT